jgi:hypothetical protein
MRPGSTVRYGLSESHHSGAHCRNPGLKKLTGPRIIEGDPDYSLTGDISCFILPTRLLLSLRVSDYITGVKTSRRWYGLRIDPQNIGHYCEERHQNFAAYIFLGYRRLPTAPMPHIVCFEVMYSVVVTGLRGTCCCQCVVRSLHVQVPINKFATSTCQGRWRAFLRREFAQGDEDYRQEMQVGVWVAMGVPLVRFKAYLVFVHVQMYIGRLTGG